MGGIIADEVRLEVLQFLLCGLDEHILHKMGLPGHFHDKAHGHAGLGVGAAEHIHHIELFPRKGLHRQVLAFLPGLLGSGLVVVGELRGGPPHGVPGVFVHDDEFVLGGAAGVDAGHHIDGPQLRQPALFKAFQPGPGLFFEQSLIGGVAEDLGNAGDAILAQIDVCHGARPLSSWNFSPKMVPGICCILYHTEPGK